MNENVFDELDKSCDEQPLRGDEWNCKTSR